MSQVAESLQDRYVRACTLARDWLVLNERSEAFLARRLDVERSVLHRFLRGQHGYTPTAHRPQTLRLLDGLERLCGRGTAPDCCCARCLRAFDALDLTREVCAVCGQTVCRRCCTRKRNWLDSAGGMEMICVRCLQSGEGEG